MTRAVDGVSSKPGAVGYSRLRRGRGQWGRSGSGRRNLFQGQGLLLSFAVSADTDDELQGLRIYPEAGGHGIYFGRLGWDERELPGLDHEIAEVGAEIEHLHLGGFVAAIGEPQIEAHGWLIAGDDVRRGRAVAATMPSRPAVATVSRATVSTSAATSTPSAKSTEASAFKYALLRFFAGAKTDAIEHDLGFELAVEKHPVRRHLGGGFWRRRTRLREGATPAWPISLTPGKGEQCKRS